MQRKEREAGPDLIRVFAALFVVAVHFYLNCNYYETPLIGSRMFVMTFCRWFFMICVPLFMMLTGYFKCHKSFTKEHYLSLCPILITYVVIAVLKVIVSNLYYGAGYYTVLSAIKAIASYQMAWYVGMYVALMLLIPFLNKLWEALDAKQHKWLILTLTVIGSLYPLFPYFIPSYWQLLYPFVFYYLGVYIRTYRPKIRAIWAVLAILAATAIEAVVSYLAARGGFFRPEVLAQVDSGYSVLTVVIAACAFFLLFYDVKIKSPLLSTILARISEVSLEIYLFTGIYDVIIFSFLKQQRTQATEFFWLFFLTVPLNFILSAGSGMLLKLILSPLTKLMKPKKKEAGSKKQE